jgi:hypothetical protein
MKITEENKNINDKSKVESEKSEMVHETTGYPSFPVLMLLALVCIASLLVPMHHKAEKWATVKLVEKN